MAGQYSLKTFLRRAPNYLLEPYLAGLGLGESMGWKQLGETDIEPVYRAIEAAGEKTQAQIGCDFQEVHEMANAGGTQMLIEEGRDRHHQVYLAEPFEEMRSHTERAFWAFLEHPKVFKVARRFRHADRLRWRKRRDLPIGEPGADEDTTDRLAAAISDYYLKAEGRGRGCHADHYARGERLYWFVYPEDYAEGRLVYDDSHELQVETQRPAFEIVFVYDRADGSLDTSVSGVKKTLESLQGVFCAVVLGVEPDLVDRTEVVYQLDDLLSSNFPFEVRPEDGVDEVGVRLLRLELVGAGRPRITIEVEAGAGNHVLYELLDEVLTSTRTSRDAVRVTKATLRLQFRHEDGGRPRALSFYVTHPDGCSLKHEAAHEVARELLKRWGIDVSGRAEDGSDLPKRTVQRTFRV